MITDRRSAGPQFRCERRKNPMAENNRKWVLKSRPEGMVDRANFEWRVEPRPEIRDGQFLVRNLWLSCDPAQRAWMEIDTYIPKIPLGEVMFAMSAGEVVDSKHPGFRTAPA
jgi:NADPH-dependent curcumin reductase